MSLLLEFLKTLAALWHTLAFAGGFFFVWQSYRALLGLCPHEGFWGRRVRQADLHLWLSGFAIIGLGIAISGLEAYLSNPKLWTKVVLISLWLVDTQAMRHYAVPLLRRGRRGPMLVASGISLACWVYGAFLGVAKGLAYGAVPFAALLCGFLLTMAASFALTYYLASRGPALARQ